MTLTNGRGLVIRPPGGAEGMPRPMVRFRRVVRTVARARIKPWRQIDQFVLGGTKPGIVCQLALMIRPRAADGLGVEVPTLLDTACLNHTKGYAVPANDLSLKRRRRRHRTRGCR